MRVSGHEMILSIVLQVSKFSDLSHGGRGTQDRPQWPGNCPLRSPALVLRGGRGARPPDLPLQELAQLQALCLWECPFDESARTSAASGWLRLRRYWWSFRALWTFFASPSVKWIPGWLLKGEVLQTQGWGLLGVLVCEAWWGRPSHGSPGPPEKMHLVTRTYSHEQRFSVCKVSLTVDACFPSGRMHCFRRLDSLSPVLGWQTGRLSPRWSAV